MFAEPYRDMMRPSYAALIEALKRSDGMPVSDLARELKMSYMGVKGHCVKLAKLGYLEEWRVPRGKKEVGRPEVLYRLTGRCDGLFPVAGVDLTLAVLESVRGLFGDSAPEKLLYKYFHDLQVRWAPKLKSAKSLVEKATRLADLRDRAGWFGRCHYDQDLGFRLEEFHSPLSEIYEVYPNAVRMEVQMLEKILGTRVTRREVKLGKGRMRVVYEVVTLGLRGGGASEVIPVIRDSGEGQGSLF